MAGFDKVRYLLRICFMLSASAIYTSQAFNRFYDAGDPQADIEARSALSPKTKDRVRTGLGNGQLHRRTRTNQQLRDIIKPTYFFKRWHQKSQKLRPTAWLDGLRGVAALIVTIYHYAYLWPWAQTGWGVSKDDHHFMQFYVVRIITSGGFMVRIFFVISGMFISLISCIFQVASHTRREPTNCRLSLEVLEGTLCPNLFRSGRLT